MSNFVRALKKRTNNYAFWVALFALIGGVGSLYFTGKFDISKWQDLTPLVLAFLVAAGICNDPTTGKGLSDTPSVGDKIDVKKE